VGTSAPASGLTVTADAVTQTESDAVLPLLDDGSVGGSGQLVDCILELGPPGDATGQLLGSCVEQQAVGGGSSMHSCAQSVLRAKVDLQKTKSAKELWLELGRVFKPELVPDRLHAQLVYQDAEGDWLLVTPDESWPAFTRAARKLLIQHAS
jgi:hypothetical protein